MNSFLIVLISLIVTPASFIAAIYTFSIIFKITGRNRLIVPAPTNEDDATAPIAREAGLVGLSCTERRSVLEKILPVKSYIDEIEKTKSSDNKTKTVENNDMLTVSTHDNHSLEHSEIDDTSIESSSTIHEISNINVEVGERRDVKSNENSSVSTYDNESRENSESDAEVSITTNRVSHQKLNDDGEFHEKNYDDEQELYKNVSNQCAICLEDYCEGQGVIGGNYCVHVFHKDCILEWLEKSDQCPSCRNNMYTVDEFRDAAKQSLSVERAKQLTTKNEREIQIYIRDIETGNV